MRYFLDFFIMVSNTCQTKWEQAIRKLEGDERFHKTTLDRQHEHLFRNAMREIEDVWINSLSIMFSLSYCRPNEKYSRNC